METGLLRSDDFNAIAVEGKTRYSRTLPEKSDEACFPLVFLTREAKVEASISRPLNPLKGKKGQRQQLPISGQEGGLFAGLFPFTEGGASAWATGRPRFQAEMNETRRKKSVKPSGLPSILERGGPSARMSIFD